MSKSDSTLEQERVELKEELAGLQAQFIDIDSAIREIRNDEVWKEYQSRLHYLYAQQREVQASVLICQGDLSIVNKEIKARNISANTTKEMAFDRLFWKEVKSRLDPDLFHDINKAVSEKYERSTKVSGESNKVTHSV